MAIENSAKHRRRIQELFVGVATQQMDNRINSKLGYWLCLAVIASNNDFSNVTSIPGLPHWISFWLLGYVDKKTHLPLTFRIMPCPIFVHRPIFTGGGGSEFCLTALELNTEGKKFQFFF